MTTAPPQPLDPHSESLLQQIAAQVAAVPAGQLTVTRRRQLMRDAAVLLTPPGSSPEPCARQDMTIPLDGRVLPARLYRPEAADGNAAADTLLVFFHGGGWVLGDLFTHDDACATLANTVGCPLLSVEYRKAPEHPFPAPCDDALDAYAWAHAALTGELAGLACRRVAIGGDSAGGHLAAQAMHASVDIPTAAALLIYPVADMTFDNTSYTTRGNGIGLTAEAMHWYWTQLMGNDAALTDPRAVPMHQHWQRVPPPTVVTVAWHDPLHDEGVAYAHKLQSAGAQVTLQTAPNMAHGYLRQGRINAAAGRHVRAAALAFKGLLQPA